MHLLHRNIVGFCFCPCQDLKNFKSNTSGTVSHLCVSKYLTDFVHTAMFVMTMGLVSMCCYLISMIMSMCCHILCSCLMAMLILVIMFFCHMRMTVIMFFCLMRMTVIMFFCPMRMTMIMSMQILHIMVMSVYLCIQDYIEITGINPGFRHPAYFYLKSLHRNTFKYILQHLLICSQIQQGCHCHISTDSGITLQI